jgi:hypothetical protein
MDVAKNHAAVRLHCRPISEHRRCQCYVCSDIDGGRTQCHVWRCGPVSFTDEQDGWLTDVQFRFERYFQTTDPAMRRLVSGRFFAIARECSGGSRVSTTYCSDQLSLCQSDYIAVTLGTQVTNCEIFYRFPTVSNECHAYDKATTVIHEISHVDGVYDPSTVDVDYGWPKISYLSAEQAVTNADNYQYYANGESEMEPIQCLLNYG